MRAFADYPNGHGLPQETVRMRNDHILCGTIPINDKLVFWFVFHRWDPKDYSMALKIPELIRSLTLETIKNFPVEKLEMVKNCDLSSLSLTHFRYRAPRDLLLGRFRKGTVTVAGESMHVMDPFIGQGGSAGIEDAIVLTRCLARNNMQQYEKIGEALDEYVKERRMRLVGLAAQAYLIGSLQETSSLLMKLIIIGHMAVLYRDPFGHTHCNCGCL